MTGLKKHDVSLRNCAIAWIDIHSKPLDSGRRVGSKSNGASLSNFDIGSSTSNTEDRLFDIDISWFGSRSRINSKVGRQGIDGESTAHSGTSKGDKITNGQGDHKHWVWCTCSNRRGSKRTIK